jgi:hypothetical protein
MKGAVGGNGLVERKLRKALDRRGQLRKAIAYWAVLRPCPFVVPFWPHYVLAVARRYQGEGDHGKGPGAMDCRDAVGPDARRSWRSTSGGGGGREVVVADGSHRGRPLKFPDIQVQELPSQMGCLVLVPGRTIPVLRGLGLPTDGLRTGRITDLLPMLDGPCYSLAPIPDAGPSCLLDGPWTLCRSHLSSPR